MTKSPLVTFLIIVLFTIFGPSVAIAGPDASREYSKANKLFTEKKFSDAIVLYQSTLSSPSNDIARSILYTRIGDSYFQLGDYRQARDAYRGALKDQKRPERPPTQYWIGFCTFLLGKDAEATAEFLKIPEIYPDSGMWVSTAYYWAGRASERMGKKDQAAEFYRKAGGKGKSAQNRFALKKAEAVKGK